MQIAKVVFNSFVSFIFLFLIAKLMGKKQIAQLDFIDYVIGISLGSIAAEMAFDVDIPFYYFLIAMAMFTILEVTLSLIGRKSTFLKKFIVGSPVILIDDGKLQYQNIKKTKLTINEFLSLCREQGYFNLSEISYCLFETSGKISILPKSFAMPVVAEDLNISHPRSSLTHHLILDGKVVENSLKSLGKNREWLYSKINIKNDEQIESIALAIYDDQQDTVHVHPKD